MGGGFDLWELLFPSKCILCRKLLLAHEKHACEACLSKFSPYSGEGMWLPGIAQWTAVWCYEGVVRDSLHRYKFCGNRYYGEHFGKLLAQKVDEKFHGQYDVIVYVPVSRRRKWERGYDQTLLVAESMGKALGMKPTKAIIKTRHNVAQSSLERKIQRENNVRGAYRIADRNLISGKRVLLIDDIITTGSTVAECAKVLRAAGAKEVLCAAVAATQGRNR